MGQRRAVEVEFLRLVLREIADAQRAGAEMGAALRFQPPGEQLRQRGLAIAVGAQERDPVVRVQAQVQVAQDRRAAIADRAAVQRQDRRGEFLGRWEGEADRLVLDHRLDRRQAFQGLEAGLRLPRLGGLGAEAVHEGLDAGAFGRDLGVLRHLLRLPFRPDAHEIREIARVERDPAAIEMRDGIHAAFQQAAVMADHDRRAGEALQPGFQPQRGFEVEVVGRLVQQQ